MEDKGEQIKFEPPSESLKTPESDLNRVLNNWVGERPRILANQRGMRRYVADAIITDVLDPVDNPKIPPSVRDFRGYVDNAVTATTGKLNIQPREENNILKKSDDLRDPVTKTKFFTQVRRGENSWISEEVEKDSGRIISQAQIGDNGEFKLTLNFPEQRYEERNANPKIENASEYPTGTKVLFLKHLASLGIISWKGKFRLVN